MALLLCAGSAMAGDGLLWSSGARLEPQARQAAELLGAAATHGLEPQDYHASELLQAVNQAEEAAQDDSAPPQAMAASLARLEPALTSALTHYLSDLHGGRIDPRLPHHDFAPPRSDAFDARAYLREAVAGQRLAEAARQAAPRLPLYEHLRQALAHYRTRVGHAAWREPLPPLPGARRGAGGKLASGQPYAGLALLAARLAAVDDLAPGTALPPRYEGALVSAVQAFQQRHGISPDGVVGPATLAQLQVTPAARARQIELALERLRWTPLLQGPHMVVINIPEFVLRAYDVQDGRISVRQEMKVIVGKALNTRTPLFDETMRAIEFSPYWNVPPSIARAEVVPRLRRDPGYFAREGLEFVGADGRADAVLSAARLDAVLAGKARIRQRPGPRNALGDIKFIFPNSDNIYLHHTPSTQLFGRDRRDFSHGCIRVEQPLALARFVLQGMPGWDEARIRQAMDKGVSSTLRLAQPVPVLIAYGTALVKQGRPYFFEDIYGLDRVLDAALRQHARSHPSTE